MTKRFSLAEDKTKSKTTHKQAATEGNYFKGMPKHLKGGNSKRRGWVKSAADSQTVNADFVNTFVVKLKGYTCFFGIRRRND